MNQNLEVLFWGVRGSYPAPGKDTLRFGGNTSCVEIRAGNERLIFDAGTGIIPLGRKIAREAAQSRKEIKVSLFLSHLHHDHIQGFPFFVPAYIPSAHIQVFGPASSDKKLRSILESNQSPQSFPISLNEMASRKTIKAVREHDEIVVFAGDANITGASQGNTGDAGLTGDAVLVKTHHSYAHPGGVLIYRVEWRGKSIVYATDTEGYAGVDQRLANFARGADLLIHDAQYTQAHYHGIPSTQGYGHSTVEMACEMAKAADVGQLLLFHHDPNYDDKAVAENEARAQRIFPESLAAREGLRIRLDEEKIFLKLHEQKADSIAERM
ncbi:MAG: MBL fold metallo-hydrolase [Chloroflexi bacterium]|nr:MBL fold metallo-hydrolase [Chloroflexota bacterium]